MYYQLVSFALIVLIILFILNVLLRLRHQRVIAKLPIDLYDVAESGLYQRFQNVDDVDLAFTKANDYEQEDNVVSRAKSKKWNAKLACKNHHIILFLGAELKNEGVIHVDKDCESIKNVLSGSEIFYVVEKFDVKKTDIIPLVTKYRPTIIHFDMHGTEKGCLALAPQGDAPFEQLAPSDLRGFFNLCSRDVLLVYFDACHTEQHAKEATNSIPIAVGMKGEIKPHVASVFSTQFYLSLENGYSAKDAFSWAREQVKISEEGNDYEIPNLEHCYNVDPGSIVFVEKTKGK